MAATDKSDNNLKFQLTQEWKMIRARKKKVLVLLKESALYFTQVEIPVMSNGRAAVKYCLCAIT